MPLFNLTVKHGRTLEEARSQLDKAVEQVRNQLGLMVQRVEWSASRDAVRLSGTGFEVGMRVDAEAVHVSADLPALAGLLRGPLEAGLKRIVQQTFQKRLP